MQIAHIVPQIGLETIRDKSYHMALAHLVEKDGFESYTEFYRRVADRGAYVIMDNGVIEGDQRPMEELVRLAQSINASEIILPDVFMDCDGTIESTVAAWKYLQEHKIEINTMIVPHGNTFSEWLYCLEQILERGVKPTCIGVPKVLVKNLGRDARIGIVKDIQEVIGYEGQAIHLLGCHENVLEIKRCFKYAKERSIPVRGADTALCYVYARNAISMTESDRPDQEAIDFSTTILDFDRLRKNIAFADAEVAGEYLKPVGNVINVDFGGGK